MRYTHLFVSKHTSANARTKHTYSLKNVDLFPLWTDNSYFYAHKQSSLQLMMEINLSEASSMRASKSRCLCLFVVSSFSHRMFIKWNEPQRTEHNCWSQIMTFFLSFSLWSFYNRQRTWFCRLCCDKKQPNSSDRTH